MSKRITWAIPVTTQENSTSIQSLFICLKHTRVSEHQSKPLLCPLALQCGPHPWSPVPVSVTHERSLNGTWSPGWDGPSQNTGGEACGL